MLAKNMPAKLTLSLCILTVVYLSCVITGHFKGLWASANEMKDIRTEVINEAGCPIAVDSATSQLELDPFGTPMAARIYIDYRNACEKPIAAVKFRIGYVNAEGQLLGTFHAPHTMPLTPGAKTSEKWRGDRLDPRTSLIKIRTLIVKFTDGSRWESEKAKTLEAAPDNVR